MKTGYVDMIVILGNICMASLLDKSQTFEPKQISFVCQLYSAYQFGRKIVIIKYNDEADSPDFGTLPRLPLGRCDLLSMETDISKILWTLKSYPELLSKYLLQDVKCACDDGGLVHPWECCSVGSCNIFCCNCGGPCRYAISRKNTVYIIIFLKTNI